eukprot:27324_5
MRKSIHLMQDDIRRSVAFIRSVTRSISEVCSRMLLMYADVCRMLNHTLLCSVTRSISKAVNLNCRVIKFQYFFQNSIFTGSLVTSLHTTFLLS